MNTPTDNEDNWQSIGDLALAIVASVIEKSQKDRRL